MKQKLLYFFLITSVASCSTSAPEVSPSTLARSPDSQASPFISPSPVPTIKPTCLATSNSVLCKVSDSFEVSLEPGSNAQLPANTELVQIDGNKFQFSTGEIIVSISDGSRLNSLLEKFNLTLKQDLTPQSSGRIHAYLLSIPIEAPLNADELFELGTELGISGKYVFFSRMGLLQFITALKVRREHATYGVISSDLNM